ncbi:hypothetical protein ABKV19_019522 [Rosa sericea]
MTKNESSVWHNESTSLEHPDREEEGPVRKHLELPSPNKGHSCWLVDQRDCVSQEPWHLPHTPPEQIKEIVYEGPFNTFVDEIDAIATYQWWEGAMYINLAVLAYSLAFSWQQWRRRLKLQRLREFVRSEYDHARLRSCRSRALYEGIKSIPPTTWYRMAAGLNAQLRLVCRGRLSVTLLPVLRWLESHANPALRNYGVRVDLAWFQATAFGYRHYGLVVYALEEDHIDGAIGNEE